jgi:hypothetical protein
MQSAADRIDRELRGVAINADVHATGIGRDQF